MNWVGVRRSKKEDSQKKENTKGFEWRGIGGTGHFCGIRLAVVKSVIISSKPMLVTVRECSC